MSGVIFICYLRSSNTGLHQFCIACLSVFDIISSIAFGFGQVPSEEKWSCTLQGFFIQFSSCVPWWTGVVALNFLLQTYFLYEDDQLSYIRIKYCFLALTYPTLSALYCLYIDGYDISTDWCWISTNYEGLRMVFWYGPVWIIFIFNCVCIFLIIKTLNAVFQDRKIRKVSLQCFAFLIIYVIIWTGPSSYRIYQFFHHGEEVFWLAFIHALILPMQGFLNFIAYMGPLFYEHCRIFFHIYVFKNPGRVDGRLFTLNRASIITREDSTIDLTTVLLPTRH